MKDAPVRPDLGDEAHDANAASIRVSDLGAPSYFPRLPMFFGFVIPK
jgi:hypothetical protein